MYINNVKVPVVQAVLTIASFGVKACSRTFEARESSSNHALTSDSVTGEYVRQCYVPRGLGKHPKSMQNDVRLIAFSISKTTTNTPFNFSLFFLLLSLFLFGRGRGERGGVKKIKQLMLNQLGQSGEDGVRSSLNGFEKMKQ